MMNRALKCEGSRDRKGDKAFLVAYNRKAISPLTNCTPDALGRKKRFKAHGG